MQYGPNTASMIVSVPHATTATSRSIGYPEPPCEPVCRPYRVRFAGLSGTNMLVPSIARSSSRYTTTREGRSLIRD